jgi:Cu/Ag efflux protein CusF
MKTVLLIGLVLFSGCAAYELQPLGANHPASPAALAAPEPQRSTTLAYTPADIPSPRPMVDVTAAEQGAHEGHGGTKAEDSAQKTATGEGKVVATVPSSGQVVVDHGEIKGFMGAMTMGYRVEPPSQLEGLKAGDQVRFTIDIPKKAIVKVEKLN